MHSHVVRLSIRTHHWPTDSGNWGLFDFIPDLDDTGTVTAVTVLRCHDMIDWGRYAPRDNDSAFDVAIKATVHGLECGSLAGDSENTVDFDEHYDPTPLWLFLSEHQAYVVDFDAADQAHHLSAISEWDDETGTWRRSTYLNYTLAWLWNQGRTLFTQVSEDLDVWDIHTVLDIPIDDDELSHYLFGVCMAVAQWGDRDECSWKHIRHALKAIDNGRRWYEGDDYNTPGGLAGNDAEADHAIAEAWEALEAYVTGSDDTASDLTDDQIEAIDAYIGETVLVAWDGCHKIYMALDQSEANSLKRYEYPHIVEGDKLDMLVALTRWWDASCSLRFINAIRYRPDGGGTEFIDVIPQFADS